MSGNPHFHAGHPLFTAICLDPLSSSPPCAGERLGTGALVIIIDDNDAIRRAVRESLLSANYSTLTFGSAQEFLAQPLSIATRPVCIVLNSELPEHEGLRFLQELRERGNGEQLVLLAGRPNYSACVRMIRAGAVDYLPRPCSQTALHQAVALAVERSAEQRRQRALCAVARSAAASLTVREREVLGLLVEGLPNREIARQLGAAEATIKVHRGRIMDKMAARSLAELLFLARQAGINPHFDLGSTRPAESSPAPAYPIGASSARLRAFTDAHGLPELETPIRAWRRELRVVGENQTRNEDSHLDSASVAGN